jgi:hypothetical protein
MTTKFSKAGKQTPVFAKTLRKRPEGITKAKKDKVQAAKKIRPLNPKMGGHP